jgi:hypothetical protein
MRKAILIVVLLVATVAFANSPVFRQRIRHVEVHGDVWSRDDGGVVSEFVCLADAEAELIDGGAWPLKHRSSGFVDGGLPNAVIDRCARHIEIRNLLDGGLQ